MTETDGLMYRHFPSHPSQKVTDYRQLVANPNVAEVISDSQGGADIKKIFYPTLENIFSYQDPRDLDLPLLEKVKWQPSTLTTSFSPSHWWTLTGLQTPIFR